MLMTKVKVGKITNLSEARYCAGMGVDFLSFPVSSVDPKTYREITSWVAGPKFGIEIESATTDLITQYQCDFISFGIDTTDASAPDFNGRKLFVCLDINDWFVQRMNLMRVKEQIVHIELNVPLLNDAAMNILLQASKDFDILLKITFAMGREQIRKLPIAGISLDGDGETKPGYKEYPLSEILEQLEVVN
jgi:phosphoribosylanthranilate isomerase